MQVTIESILYEVLRKNVGKVGKGGLCKRLTNRLTKIGYRDIMYANNCLPLFTQKAMAMTPFERLVKFVLDATLWIFLIAVVLVVWVVFADG